MKKVLSIVAALLLCVGTQAQIVSSRSTIVKTQKQASNTQWFLRAGVNMMNLSGDGIDGTDSNIGYNATLGYQKYRTQCSIFTVYFRMENRSSR